MSENGRGRERGRIEGGLAGALARWIAGVQRRARVVVILSTMLSIAALAYVLLTLGVNTSHRALISDDLDFAMEYDAFAEVFPIVDEAIFVVVDADTSARAREATEALAARLRARSERFEDVYVPGGGEFFRRQALLYLSLDELYDLSDDLAAVQPVLAELAVDSSLPNLVRILDQTMAVAQEDPSFSKNLVALFDSVSRAARAVIEGEPKPISWMEMLLRRKLPGDSARRLIVLQPYLDYDRFFPAERAIDAIREEAGSLGAEHDVTVRVTGNVALNHEEMVLVIRGAILAIIGSIVVVGAILFVAMGSWRLVGSILATLVTGLAWTAAFATFTVGSLNVISIAFAILFIGLGVDFGIHFGMRYGELLRGGRARDDALRETAQTVGGSLILCAFTTAIGFYAFVPTDFRAVGELGLISGTGMLVSLFCSLTLLPALLTLWTPDRETAGRAAPRWFTDVLIPLALRHTVAVRVIAVLLAIAAAAALPLVDFDTNVANMRDPRAESVQTFEDLLSESETSPWTIDLIAADLASARESVAALRALPEVERAVTLEDYVPADQEEKREILAELAFFLPRPPTDETGSVATAVAGAGLEAQIEALATLRDQLDAAWLTEDPLRAASAERARVQLDLFLARLETLDRKQEAVNSFESSLLGALPEQLDTLWSALEPEPVDLATLPEDLARRMLAADGRARIEVLPSEDLADDAALARFVDAVRVRYPAATGSAVSMLEWGRATVRSFQEATAAAVLAVSFVVFVLWRRLRDLLLVMVPLLLAALLTGGLAGALGIPFNFASIIVIPLLLGIGVDSGIHLVHRHRRAEREQMHLSTRQELMGSSTAQAVFFSALTTMASFGTLALSGHRGLASLGQMLLLGVTITLACNLIVLPALIRSTRHDVWEETD